jgi:hypothetical protein
VRCMANHEGVHLKIHFKTNGYTIPYRHNFFHLFFLLVLKNTTTEFHKSSVVLLMVPLTIAINSRNTRTGSNISAYIYIIIYVHVKK